MTYFSTFQHESAVTDRLLEVLHHVTRTVAAAVVRWDGAIQARRDVAAFSRLDDRTFRDLGMSRSEIQSIARHGAGDPSRRYRGQWKTRDCL